MDTTKTQIVSVFFVDIIGYSKQSVADQVAIKRAFNAHLGAAVAPIPPEGRIVLDTGDGAAVAFLQAPEDALLTSDRLMAMAYDHGEPRLYGIRSGIHFGPAVIVQDVNGFGNLVGDAINDAQRVMSFAGDHEVFASRHYAEMVARISSSFADRFVSAGTSKDKHGRAHEVSRVLPVGYQPAAPATTDKTATTATPSPTSPPTQAAPKHVASVGTGTRSSPTQIAALLGGFLVVAVAVWYFGLRTSAPAPATATSASATTPPATQGAPVASAPAPVAPTPSPVAVVVAPLEIPSKPATSSNAASPAVREKPAKALHPSEKPQPVESPRALVALTPAAKPKDLPETQSSCPQCSCPDLLTKTSLGIALNAAEARHLQTQCH